jgi:elongation factor 3
MAATFWKNPDLVIIDEPTNYLDSSEIKNLSNLIKSYQGGIIISTHNIQFARENMNIFIEIHDGKLSITN